MLKGRLEKNEKVVLHDCLDHPCWICTKGVNMGAWVCEKCGYSWGPMVSGCYNCNRPEHEKTSTSTTIDVGTPVKPSKTNEADEGLKPLYD
jgi:hypothetical protein